MSDTVRCGLGPALLANFLQRLVDEREITVEQAVAAMKNPALLSTLLEKKEDDHVGKVH